jgi:single-stranded DNA-binding protein
METTKIGPQYINKGMVQGTLARAPYLTKNGAALIVICTQSPRYNMKTKRKEMVYPRFVVYGKWAETIMANAVTGQEIQAEYHIETRRQELEDGSFKYFEDKIITDLALGSVPLKRQRTANPQPTQDAQESKNNAPLAVSLTFKEQSESELNIKAV